MSEVAQQSMFPKQLKPASRSRSSCTTPLLIIQRIATETTKHKWKTQNSTVGFFVKMYSTSQSKLLMFHGCPTITITMSSCETHVPAKESGRNLFPLMVLYANISYPGIYGVEWGPKSPKIYSGQTMHV